MTTVAGNPVPTTTRRNDIDWLRTLAVLLLFVFHGARLFNAGEEFYIRNAVESRALAVLIDYLETWHMPLFFVLAGMSTWYALRSRGAGGYIVERLRRLGVPFIFGVLVLVAPQSYLGYRSHMGYSGSYWAWYPRFSQLMADDMDGFFLGGHTWGQLWFIFHLLLYSIVALPLLLLIRRAALKGSLTGVARFFARPGAMLLWFIPLMLVDDVGDIAGGNPAYYIIVFIYGFLLMSDSNFEEGIRRLRLPALILGLGLQVVCSIFEVYGWPNLGSGWAIGLAEVFVDDLMPWLSLMAILGYGRTLLTRGSPALSYATEAAYPYYILHQTVIVVLGYYIVRWSLGLGVKYVLVVIGSLLVTAALYEGLVRHWNVSRFLFGMRPKRKRT